MDNGPSSVTGTLFTALYKRAISLNLNSKKLNNVPERVCKLTNLSVLLLCNNFISRLPAELLSLQQICDYIGLFSICNACKLAELNLGNNALKEIPAVLGHLESLKKLYLFRNQITVLPPAAIGCLQNLVVLNLNHNKIQKLPPEIKSLSKLQHLSLLDNNLEELPEEICHLTELSELNLTYNRLSCLPQQLYQCRKLTKLYVARNKLTHLPEGIKVLTKLQTLDVAGNKLTIFPVEFHLLSLKELYFEDNRFLQCHPAPVMQDIEVLALKEQVSRLILREQRNRFSVVHKMLPHYPYLATLLASSSCCPVCQGPFLTTWLECVHFIHLKKDMKMRNLLTIPVRVLLCSYKCFNADGHSYYGVTTR